MAPPVPPKEETAVFCLNFELSTIVSLPSIYIAPPTRPLVFVNDEFVMFASLPAI